MNKNVSSNGRSIYTQWSKWNIIVFKYENGQKGWNNNILAKLYFEYKSTERGELQTMRHDRQQLTCKQTKQEQRAITQTLWNKHNFGAPALPNGQQLLLNKTCKPKTQFCYCECKILIMKTW